ncbi:hypothetical protein HQ587_05005 [bacterium]|nr:hypothetical protein [bacterium]
MIQKPHLISSLMLLILMPFVSFAVTMSGRIDADETWTLSDSPIALESVITIGRYATVTIEPGVELLFAEDAGIIIMGKLVARGTPEDSIRFTSAGEQSKGAWGGLYFRGSWSSKPVKEADEIIRKEPEIFEDGQGNTYTKIGDYYKRQDGVYFYETKDGDFKEYKGIIKEEKAEPVQLDTLTVSLLEFCIIEYAGGPVESGSAIEISDSNPIIINSTIRNCSGETGTIRCSTKAKPLIGGCLITENHAIRGGAIGVSLNAHVVLRNNSFIYNSSDDHGGCIYISMASADILSNRFLGNSSEAHGGAIYASLVPKLIIRGNCFIGNRSPERSNTLFLSNRIDAEIKDNIFDTFESTGVEIWVQNVNKDIDATDNFWGDPNSFSFSDIIRDSRVDAAEHHIYHDPYYWAPPTQHPTNPASVDSIILCRNDYYYDEIPRGVAEGAPLRIRLNGLDSNPYFRDVVRVRITSEYDPDGIVMSLRETAENSGVWIGRGRVAEVTDQEKYAISDYEGGHVEIFAPSAPDVVARYRTMSPKPLAEDLTVDNTGPADLLHLIDHVPVFTWRYFDVIEEPQMSYKLKVFSAIDGQITGSPIWDTGEVQTEVKTVIYTGTQLEDGRSYITQLNVNNDRFWSDTVDLLIRLNSLPTVPQPDRPAADELVPTLTPELFALVSQDGEDDSLTYRFEVYTLEDEKMVGSQGGVLPSCSAADPQAGTPAPPVQVSLLIANSLVENAGYNFRVKASDPLEEGPWSDFRRFWTNSIEEPADPFNLKYPLERADIYLLHPTIEWETAIDPDPLSYVRYTVEIDKTITFSDARVYTDLEPTSFTLPDSLDNATEYFWRIIATDNTERTTVSSSVGNFYVDTTPSIPVPDAPMAGEERMPPDLLTWESSSDPNPDDLIFYEVEIYQTDQLVEVTAEITKWTEIAIPVESLNRWEALVDNHVYYWRVRSRDNHTAASEFSLQGSFFYNRYNDPPAAVDAITAPPDTVMGTTDIMFRWTESSDPDLSDPASTLVYDLQCTLGEFETGEVRTFTSQAGRTELVAPLDDNLLWYYRIRTRDNEEAVSDWNTVDSVLVNYAEDNPTPFSLQFPRQDSLIVELDSLKFNWASSSDPDWESSIIYRVELSPDEGEKFTAKTAKTFFNFKEGLTNELGYRWSVTAVDNTGLETVVQSGFSFRTNTTPTVPAAAPMPEELMPDDPLQFTGATDPNPVDILTYTVELAPDRSFASPLVHVEELPHSEGIMTAAVGSLTGQEELDDDHDYYFRVHATDNHGYDGAYSEPVIFRFNRENDAPGSPAGPFAPIDSSVIRNRNPSLDWNAASDIDLTDPPEKLVYDIRLDYDEEFEKDSKLEYATGAGITEFDVPDPLKDNTLWFWQVRTRDDDGAVSDWNPMQPFLVNVVEDSPTVAQLTTPASNELLNYLGPIEFKWIASEDIDFMSSITYRIEYGTSPDLGGAVVVENLTDPTYTAAYPLENTTYYWRVTAVDNTGLETASVIESFTLDTRPSIPDPLTPQPAPPIEIAELLSDGVIIWNQATDPDPTDKITYTIQVGIKLEPEAMDVVSAEGIEETSIPITTWKDDLQDDQIYKWRVKSIDEHGIESDWSEQLTFFYNPVNDNPGAVSGILSPADDIEVSSITLDWDEASDVDISDPPQRIAYTLEITMDPVFRSDIATVNIEQGITTHSPVGLKDDARWYWRVRAADDEGAEGPVSPVKGFMFNSRNDPPGEIPGLTKPDEGEEISSVILSWEAASDKDITDSAAVAYRVEFCLNRDFSGEITEIITEPMVTGVSPTGLKDDSWWFWRVRAVDDDDAAGTVSEIRGFIYNAANNPPDAVPALTSPTPDQEVRLVTLKWEKAVDRDVFDTSESLRYSVELSLDKGFTGKIIKVSTEAGIVTAEPADLTDDNRWFWRVQAIDDENVQGEYSPVTSFILNTQNDAPGTVPAMTSPVEGEEVATVELKWTAAPDRDLTDPPEKLSYTIELCMEKDFSGEIRTVKTGQGVISINVDGLKDDSYWFWRIRAVDDDGAEGPVSGIKGFIYNAGNNPPGVVAALLEPEDGPEITSVKLAWSPAEDLDLTDTPDKLSYLVEFSRDRAFSGKIVELRTQPSVTTASPTNIEDNTTWFWRVKAVDDDGSTGLPSAEVRSFTFNSRNDPPDKIENLLEPSDNEQVTSVTLKWEAANDPDPFDPSDELTYRIQISRSRSFSPANEVIGLSTGAGVTTTAPDGLGDNQVWYWRVSAVDDEGAESVFSSPASFIHNIQNDAPQAFEISSPADGAQIDGKSVKLSWTEAKDVDPGDEVTYTVVIASDASFTTGLGTFRDIKGTEFTVPEDVIGTGGKLFWKLSAADKQGAVMWGSNSDNVPRSFTVNVPQPAQP